MRWPRALSIQLPAAEPVNNSCATLRSMPARSAASVKQALKHGIEIIYHASYTDSETLHHAVLESGATLLQKPVAPDELCAKVREVLDASR